MAAQSLFVKVAENGVPDGEFTVDVLHLQGIAHVVYDHGDGFVHQFITHFEVIVGNVVSPVDVAGFFSVGVVELAQNASDSFIGDDDGSSVHEFCSEVFSDFPRNSFDRFVAKETFESGMRIHRRRVTNVPQRVSVAAHSIRFIHRRIHHRIVLVHSFY